MTASSINDRSRIRAPVILLTLACLLTGASTEAAVDQVYECNQDGTVTFSDEPCSGDEQVREVEYDPSPPDSNQNEPAQTSGNAQTTEDEASAIAQSRVLDTEILEAKQQISRLQIERTTRLAEMREQRRLGSEDRDRAAWLEQMDQKIESTYQDYSAQIITATARLNDLKARRAALGVGGQSLEQE